MITSKMTNVKHVVEAIAERVRKLADESMPSLRLEQTGESARGAAKYAALGMSRGQLIEAILLDDYCEDSPRELEER